MEDKYLKHRYRLETYKSRDQKHICPACGKKSLVLYVDVETEDYLSTTVGRCDREEKCGYHKRPRDYFNETGTEPKKDYFFPKKPKDDKQNNTSFSAVSMKLVEATERDYQRNNFAAFLVTKFGVDATMQAIRKYRVGTCKFWNGATVFWQIDQSGKCRTGKIMLYDRITGHRVKNPVSKISWVHHLQMFNDFKLRQCLFGAHLLRDTAKPIAIVESEKTAIIASIFFPDAIWVATGGIGNLREETTRCLIGRRIYLFPDLDAESKWILKASAIPALRTAVASTWLMRNSTSEQKEQGLDIGDYLLTLPRGTPLQLSDFI